MSRPPLPQIDSLDPETPLSVLSRFATTTREQDMTDFTVVAETPVGGMRNPFTRQPSIAGLAVLVDDVAGRVNYGSSDTCVGG